MLCALRLRLLESWLDVEELYLPYKEAPHQGYYCAWSRSFSFGSFNFTRMQLICRKKLRNWLVKLSSNSRSYSSWWWIFWTEYDFEDTKLGGLGPTTRCRLLPSIVSSLKDGDLDEKQVFQIYYDFSGKVATMRWPTLLSAGGES